MSTRLLRVLCDGQFVGRLACSAAGDIAFEYDSAWLDKGFDLAPSSLSWRADLQRAARPLFKGLHGAFNDSLPDGWGLLLMDRALKQLRGLDRNQITPLDRLAYIGSRGMGALEYQPELPPQHDDGDINLAELAHQADLVLHGATDDVLETLRIQGGSPGGARPKVTVTFSADMRRCRSGFGPLPADFSHWIVKFRNVELEKPDVGRLECAYADMARAAGLNMPRTEIVSLSAGKRTEACFAVERFDRQAHRKLHFLSLSGYAYADHRAPCMDYIDVLAAVRKLCRSQSAVDAAFRLMVFNILAHNKDDHTKNFGFLLDPQKPVWHLAPAFDLTFNDGMGSEHTTSINGRGNPSFKDILEVAKRNNVRGWPTILEEVRAAIATWRRHAELHGIGASRVRAIALALADIDNQCRPES